MMYKKNVTKLCNIQCFHILSEKVIKKNVEYVSVYLYVYMHHNHSLAYIPPIQYTTFIIHYTTVAP